MNIRNTRAALQRLSVPDGHTDDPDAGLAVVLAWVAAMTILQVMRQHGVALWDSIWAEDGGIFLAQAMSGRFLPTLFEPHAGYVQLAPRLLGGVAAALPLEHAAVTIAVGSSLVVSLLSVYVYFTSSTLLHARWTRVTLAVLVVLLRATACETTVSGANLHWYLLCACFWRLVAPTTSWPWVAVSGVVAARAALSDPLAGLLLPLALLRVLTGTTWRCRVVPVVFAVALALQLALGALQEAPQPFQAAHFAALPGIFALRVAGSLLVGDRFLDDFWKRFGPAFAWPCLVVVVLVALYGFVKDDGARRFYLVVSVVYSAVFLGVTLMLRGTAHFLDRENFTLNGSRYTLVPILFLVVAVLFAVERPGRRVPATSWRTLQVVVVLYVSALVVVNYSNTSVRTNAPSWKARLAVARRDCATGAAPGGVVRIALGPEPDLFAVGATCERIK